MGPHDGHVLAARIFAALTLLSLIATVSFAVAAVRQRLRRQIDPLSLTAQKEAQKR